MDGLLVDDICAGSELVRTEPVNIAESSVKPRITVARPATADGMSQTSNHPRLLSTNWKAGKLICIAKASPTDARIEFKSEPGMAGRESSRKPVRMD